MPFGLDANGLTIPTFREIREDLIAKLQASPLGESNSYDDDQAVFGILINIVSEVTKDVWDDLQDVYASAYLGASGVSLDNVLNITGSARLDQAQSTISVQLSGTPGTVLVANRQFEVDSTKERWTIPEEVTLDATTGLANVNAVSVNFGPIQGLVSDTYTIVTAVNGWNSVTALENANKGRLTQTDAQARERQQNLLAQKGNATFEALQADLLLLEGVDSARVRFNDENFQVGDLEPKSFEAVVKGGTEADIVETVWNNKPLGAKAIGDLSAVYIDSTKTERTIKYSRPTDRAIEVVLTGTKDNTTFPIDGNAQISAAIVNYIETLSIADDVIALQILTAAIKAVPEASILTLAVAIDFLGGTPANQNLIISDKEQAVVSPGDISISIV